jgi:hypothetical protein
MADIFKDIILVNPPLTKKAKKAQKLKRSAKKNEKKMVKSCPIPDYIIDQWIETMSGKPKKMPVGCIPLLYCQKDDYSPWLYATITSVYRKRTEWYKLITGMWKGPNLVEPSLPITLKHSNPFFYNQAISIHLDKLMRLNNTLRMIILRCVQRRLLAKMDKRVVGEDDLHTTTRIPTVAMVSVYDFQTRAKYVFHTNTILKMIISSLKYCAYGISTPKAPKNPYTNLEWTNPQLMSITQQIVRNLVGLHRIPPSLFLNYYNCNYNIPLFAKFCEADLGINAALELFKQKDDPTTQDIYAEVIDAVLDEEDITISTRMRNMIIERKLPDTLQNRWDTIVLALWIDSNNHVLYGPYKTYTEIIDDLKKTCNDTRSYLFQLSRSARRPRPPPTNNSLIRTYALGVLIDAAIYTENVLEFTEDPPLTVNL